MNPDLNSSPLTSAQSWIVENISSLISSNLDDENDCTLTMPNENRNSKQTSLNQSNEDDSPEVARTLAVTEENFGNNAERLTKRPFSPELIANDNYGIDGERLNMFSDTNKFLSQTNQLKSNQFEEFDSQTLPLKPFPTSSSFYDDLNMMTLPTLQPPPLMLQQQQQQHQPGSHDNYLTESNGYCMTNDSTSVKKKKLTNYSLSSSNLPMVSVTDPNNHMMNNSASMTSFNEDDFHKNLSNSSYNSSFGSGMVSSASYNSHLSSFMNGNDMKQQQQLQDNGQQQQQQTVSYEKLFDMLIKGNDNGQAIINDEDCLNGNKWSDGFNKSENNNGNILSAQQQQEIINSSYYDLMNKNYSFKKLQQEQQQYLQMACNEPVTNFGQYTKKDYDQDLFQHRLEKRAWKPEPNLVDGFMNHSQAKHDQYHQQQKFQKKITKSSTTMFNQDLCNQAQKQGQYFPHSTSFDNIGCLNKLKPMKPLVNDFMSTSNASNDFLLESSFNNTSANNGAMNKSGYYNSSLNMSGCHGNNNKMNGMNVHGSSMLNTSSCSTNSGVSGNAGKELPILHVRNLDYKISADEWKRILLENFRKHSKEVLSVNVVTNADKSLLGIVKLATKEDAVLAKNCLHHKKIGYKRLNVTFAATNNSPKSKIVALLKTNDLKEMPLTRFISLYEAKYNQSIAINELFSLKEIVQIFHKDGQGRQIKLIGRNFQSNSDQEEENLRHSPYCSLHSQKPDMSYQMSLANGAGSMGVGSLTNGSVNVSPVIGWLPNVIISIRTFKSAVHKLLNDHGGQMPLLSFMDCYKCCIFNDSSLVNHRGGNNNSNNNSNLAMNQSTNGNNSNNNISGISSNPNTDLSYQLVIDNENGVPLEHLITCAQDVQIQYNQGFFKQLQWENDKSKPINLQSRNSTTNIKHRQNMTDQTESYVNDLDESIEDSQRKLNQFSHEVVELFKEKPRCIIQMSNFTTEYHKKYGRQLRLADYDSSLYQNLKELLEAIPHILQILDSQYDKKLTLTHRVQVRRFSNDLIKVLKSHSTKQMFADEYPTSYEKHFGRKFEIRDYGVCFLEDMLAELPESIICRKEIEGRTFIQIPKIVQMDEERLCTNRLTFDIIDMLKHKPRFSIQFNKFIPNFHHHFGRQCKLSNYGFTKLIELLEAMPDTVHVINKDNLQFVQLKENIMLDLICSNIVKYLEDSNLKLKITLAKLEEIYNSRYEAIFYQDFGCDTFSQLFRILPLKKHFVSVQPIVNKGVDVNTEDSIEWIIQSECFNEKELKKVCKLMLRKLIDEQEETLMFLLKESKSANNSKPFRFADLCELLMCDNQISMINTIYNNRSVHFLKKTLSDYLVFDDKDETVIVGLSDLYVFAKQIRNIFKYSKLSANDMTMTIPELEFLYNQAYVKNGVTKDGSFKMQDSALGKPTTDNGHSCLPFKRLGFIDVTLLFSQGINLLVTVKKYAEKRVCLNREFWSKSLVSDIASQNISSDSFSSPSSISPINSRTQANTSMRTPFTNITPFTNNNSNGTPMSDRMSSSFSSNSLNYSRRSNGFNTNTSLCNTSTISNDGNGTSGAY